MNVHWHVSNSQLMRFARKFTHSLCTELKIVEAKRINPIVSIIMIIVKRLKHNLLSVWAALSVDIHTVECKQLTSLRICMHFHLHGFLFHIICYELSSTFLTNTSALRGKKLVVIMYTNLKYRFECRSIDLWTLALIISIAIV